MSMEDRNWGTKQDIAHKDIDKDPNSPLYLSPDDWSQFLQRYYQIVQ